MSRILNRIVRHCRVAVLALLALIAPATHAAERDTTGGTGDSSTPRAASMESARPDAARASAPVHGKQASHPKTTATGKAHPRARAAHHQAARHPPHARTHAPAVSLDPSDNPLVREFIDTLVAREGLERSALTQVFSKTVFRPEVLRLISPPPVAFKRSWRAYRARFLDPLRIREGVRFWRDNRDALERASLTWGVPEEIVVAIIGIETVYGRVTGTFRVVDALSTLAFGYPPRAEFFREELEQFLLYTRDSGIDPLTVNGSYAGAIGLPQFMPGSIRRYAVDFDDDGRVDLRASPRDAIGSVARFLSGHGWNEGEPTHFDVTLDAQARTGPLLEAGIEPRFLPEELASAGVRVDPRAPADLRLALIDLPNGEEAPNWYAGARNFYAITRYNRSSFYAMAVIELAQAISSARQ